jgi:hypothetical protein
MAACGRAYDHASCASIAGVHDSGTGTPESAVQSASPVVADASLPGSRPAHRGGYALRDKPKTSGHTLKKEMKGAKVILEALEDGGWARVTDGNIKGRMRASVLGLIPPGP